MGSVVGYRGLVQQTGIQRMSIIIVDKFVACTYTPNPFRSWFPALASDPHSPWCS